MKHYETLYCMYLAFHVEALPLTASYTDHNGDLFFVPHFGRQTPLLPPSDLGPLVGFRTGGQHRGSGSELRIFGFETKDPNFPLWRLSKIWNFLHGAQPHPASHN